MFNLVLVIVSIALVAALTLATVSYSSPWIKRAQDSEMVVRNAIIQLEAAYDVVTAAADGVPPAPTNAADGGLSANFLSALKFLPPAPGGLTWSYGRRANDGSRYANMDFFCLSPLNGAMDEGAWRGLLRAKAVFSPDQFVATSQCGGAPIASTSDAAPGVATYYVMYRPGLGR